LYIYEPVWTVAGPIVVLWLFSVVFPLLHGVWLDADPSVKVLSVSGSRPGRFGTLWFSHTPGGWLDCALLWWAFASLITLYVCVTVDCLYVGFIDDCCGQG